MSFRPEILLGAVVAMLLLLPVLAYFRRRGVSEEKFGGWLIVISIALMVGGFGLASLHSYFMTWHQSSDGMPYQTDPAFPFRTGGAVMIILGFFALVGWLRYGRNR